MFRIVVLASAGGGNFEAVVQKQKQYGYTVTKLIVDRECGAVEKASRYGIESVCLERKNLSKLLGENIPINTDLIVLCGWLTILEREFLDCWKGKVINSHPSLLPKYGGKGMYGVKVHEAVMKNKEEYTGCTVHYVNEAIDGGQIILQEKIKIDYTLTPWELGGQVFQIENRLIVKAIEKIIKERR